MCKRELCEHIIALVANTADLLIEEIKSTSRRPEIVDARYLAIYIMLQQGVQVNRIAEYMGMSERNIYHVKERFCDRVIYGDPMIEQYYNSVLQALK